MNAALTRSAAVVQARIRVLDTLSQMLVDLQDMQAHRKLKLDFEEYILKLSHQETIPNDPLKHVENELRQLDKSLVSVNEFVTCSMKFGAEIMSPPQYGGLSEQALCKLLAEAKDRKVNLHSQIAALRATISLAALSPSGDILPELLAIASLQPADYKLMDLPCQDLLHFTQLGGSLYDSVVAHLKALEERCNELLNLRTQHLETIATALRAAKAGNYLTARAQVKELAPLFADVDYPSVESECAQYDKELNNWESSFRDLSAQVQPTKRVSFSAMFRCSERCRLIDSFLADCRPHLVSSGNSEYDCAARDLLARLSENCGQLKTSCRRAATRKTWQVVLLSMLIMAFGLALIMSMDQVRKKKELDARVLQIQNEYDQAKNLLLRAFAKERDLLNMAQRKDEEGVISRHSDISIDITSAYDQQSIKAKKTFDERSNAEETMISKSKQEEKAQAEQAERDLLSKIEALKKVANAYPATPEIHAKSYQAREQLAAIQRRRQSDVDVNDTIERKYSSMLKQQRDQIKKAYQEEQSRLISERDEKIRQNNLSKDRELRTIQLTFEKRLEPLISKRDADLSNLQRQAEHTIEEWKQKIFGVKTVNNNTNSIEFLRSHENSLHQGANP